MDLQKNNIKSQIFWSLKKNVCFCKKIKRQIILLFYPSCLIQGRKRLTTHQYLVGIPRFVN